MMNFRNLKSCHNLAPDIERDALVVDKSACPRTVSLDRVLRHADRNGVIGMIRMPAVAIHRFVLHAPLLAEVMPTNKANDFNELL
jgi:hypothetical protein